MDTIYMVYNNSGLVLYVMNKTQYMTVKPEEEKVPKNQTFFPRIIHEFDDGADEKPMIYGRHQQ